MLNLSILCQSNCYSSELILSVVLPNYSTCCPAFCYVILNSLWHGANFYIASWCNITLKGAVSKALSFFLDSLLLQLITCMYHIFLRIQTETYIIKVFLLYVTLSKIPCKVISCFKFQPLMALEISTEVTLLQHPFRVLALWNLHIHTILSLEKVKAFWDDPYISFHYIIEQVHIPSPSH